jgi:hypothetical protein
MLRDLLDRISLLQKFYDHDWLLHLRGINVGDRWDALADNWMPIARCGNYAFNDVHATMAFIGSGRFGAVNDVLEAQQTAMARGDDNAVFTRDVGHPLTLAIKAFADGDYGTSVDLIRSVREIAHRFGGSHAQRDLLDLTLIEAALRGNQRNLAHALSAERQPNRPDSPLSSRFEERAVRLKAAA